MVPAHGPIAQKRTLNAFRPRFALKNKYIWHTLRTNKPMHAHVLRFCATLIGPFEKIRARRVPVIIRVYDRSFGMLRAFSVPPLGTSSSSVP